MIVHGCVCPGDEQKTVGSSALFAGRLRIAETSAMPASASEYAVWLALLRPEPRELELVA